ncbi:FAD-dependent oxidoreductase [Kitasatospora sp. NPDC048365]|uniref:FAD-dependent oxidoreductase n=1 Tax=Kitasatospora sp. NPDC048365 TaxID=3364050 RepID=UPI003714664D
MTAEHARQAEQTDQDQYDVVVVGGGAAGLSGALALARARRSVLVVDSGQPRNAPAGHVHNFLAREGTSPEELLAAGRAEVAGYGGRVTDGRVVRAERDGDGFRLTLAADGAGPASDASREVRARRLLVTTGLVDELPEVPGLAARWGRDVLHCPYCHGWEVRDRRIGLLATGPLAWHQAEMWRQWSPEVVVLLHGTERPAPEQAERLAARGIPVVTGPVAELETADDALTGVRLASGERVALDALVVTARVTARAELLESLELAPEPVEFGGLVVGSQIAADPVGATAAPGVWVAGNVADVQAQVVTAAAAGLKAGAAINADLIAEDTRAAVAEHRVRVGAMFEQEAWEERYRSRPVLWSGRPNPQLVVEADSLKPGRALEVGAGEGADALWLAERGWRVDAVDISATALERAAAHAVGRPGAESVTWVRADLREEPPTEGGYDLVTAQYMHLPGAARTELYARLADAVAPGGTLLLVGHDPSDLRVATRSALMPDALFTGGELASALDPDRWQVAAAETRTREVVDGDGNSVLVRDAVLVALRREDA